MDARIYQFGRLLAVSVCLALVSATAGNALAAAGYQTRNFTVSAPTPQLAKEIGDAAEVWRKQLSIEWIGKEMPPWSKPCPINAKIANGAGGATSFIFDRGEVFGWKMDIQGSRERILDSVLPHEVTHTIFASHFRKPLPRWADEGACTTVEHRSEIAKQERNLISYLKTGRGIPFKQMFAMKDYPSDVMPLYAQGHSTAQWLIEYRGKEAFLTFLADGMRDENWERAVKQHYGFDNLMVMQTAWNDWVKQGRPRLAPQGPTDAVLASNTRSDAAQAASIAGATDDSSTFAQQPILRTQSPDAITPIPATPVRESATPVSTGPVTVAASGSVYAEAAARAKHERQAVGDSRSASNPAVSVYDASRATGTIRR